jgi:hypothetical protein
LHVVFLSINLDIDSIRRRVLVYEAYPDIGTTWSRTKIIETIKCVLK